MSTEKSRKELEAAIGAFAVEQLPVAATGFWSALGYESQKRMLSSGSPAEFITLVENRLDQSLGHFQSWKQAHILFQLADDDVAALSRGQLSFTTQQGVLFGSMESFLFVAIELNEEEQKRSTLADISRALNKLFRMPVILFFKHGDLVSLATVGRRVNKRDASLDVLEKVTLIKDIRIGGAHRAHIEILSDLAIDEISQFADFKRKPESFADLFALWQKALSASLLNKRFYNDLKYWYARACETVVFPKGAPSNQMSVIRMITRLMFIWFIKEKGLVRKELFDPVALTELLGKAPDQHPNESNYYKAILQNLFFATLNTNPEESARRFRERKKGEVANDEYLVHTVFRYKAAFKSEAAADEALKIFRTIPYLNGGLFECLDREIDTDELDRPGIKGKTIKESLRNKQVEVLRVDGFSERPETADNRLSVPNKLFFGGEREPINFSKIYGAGAKNAKVKGLIDIFIHYKFTVDEHTPLEEEVALDPELLGHVFENLLAEVNPDTQPTARKASGSFYTPRVVVDYMVDEAVIAYLQHKMQPVTSTAPPRQDFLRLGSAPGELELEEIIPEQPHRRPDPELEKRLRQLLSYTEEKHAFGEESERQRLVAAIDVLRALDPACGSGAFPMGMLQKLVHILKKLDPDNFLWKAQQTAPLLAQFAAAKSNPDVNARREQTARVEDDLKRLEVRFSDANYPDYSRKLFLIEKCLFGVDIQPIAVQIAKLRFFISLIVSQKLDIAKDNWNINPLPNLETKLVAANALITINRSGEQIGFASSRKEIDDLEQQLRQGRADHFALRTYRAKREWRSKDKLLRRQLSVLLQADGFGSADAARVAGWDPYDQNSSADFFDAETMFLTPKGFDVLIANPPYIKEFTWRHAFDGIRDSPYYQGKMDLWYMFACQALDQLRAPSGVLSLIATNNWVTNAGASILRNVLASRVRILKLVDFVDYKIFGADIQTMILVARNDSSGTSYPFDLRRLRLESATEEDMQNLLQGVSADGLEYLSPAFVRQNFRFVSRNCGSVLAQEVYQVHDIARVLSL